MMKAIDVKHPSVSNKVRGGRPKVYPIIAFLAIFFIVSINS